MKYLLLPNTNKSYYYSPYIVGIFGSTVIISVVKWNQNYNNSKETLEFLELNPVDMSISTHAVYEGEGIFSPVTKIYGNKLISSFFVRKNGIWDIGITIYDLVSNRLDISYSLGAELEYPGELSFELLNGDIILLVYTVAPTRGLKALKLFLSNDGKIIYNCEFDKSIFSPSLIKNQDNLYLVWNQLEERGGSSILVSMLDSSGEKEIYRIELPNRTNFNFHPFITGDSFREGVWVSWYSQLNDTSLLTSIQFVFIKNGVIYYPKQQLELSLELQEGEDQSLEFPFIVISKKGICILARSSHNYWIITYNKIQRKYEYIPVDEKGWGGRGKEISGIWVQDNFIVAFKDKNGISVVKLEGIEASLPNLSKDFNKRKKTSYSFKKPKDKVTINGYTLFKGDIHIHSANSDGTSELIRWIIRNKFYYQDDFIAITDHESFLGNKITLSLWDYYKGVSDYFCSDDFVTLLGYEWTGKPYPGPGHVCIYLKNKYKPFFSREITGLDFEGLSYLISLLDEDYILIPHHIGWTGMDIERFNEKLSPLIEICSCHGSYEVQGEGDIGQRGEPLSGYFLRELLRKGLKFGFCAGSDGHGLRFHHGICKKEDSHRTGLTFLWLKEKLSKESVWEAIKQRRCYATSGEFIIIWFDIDDKPMGSMVNLKEDSYINFFVKAKSGIKEVSLIGENERFDLLIESNTTVIERRKLPYKGIFHTKNSWIYLRVILDGGEIGWASPIFIHF